MINRLMTNNITIKKCCPTCVFKFISFYQNGNVKKTKYFPEVWLRSEELSYTSKGSKRVSINKYHQSVEDSTKAYINYNGTILPPIPLEFDKLTDLDQINKKIKTIITFG